MLKTVASRLLFVLLITTFSVSNIYFAWTLPQTHPTDWYFWTQREPDAPGTWSRIQRSPHPYVSPQSYTSSVAIERAREEWNKRCGMFAASGLVAKYRGISLCNPGNQEGAGLEESRAEFAAQVNGDYETYYWELAKRHIAATLLALVIWLVAPAVYLIAKWIMEPRRRQLD